MPDWKRVCAGVGPAIIASFALALSCVANFACETIKFTNQGEIPDVADGTLHFGPWYQQSTQVSQVNDAYFVRNVCIAYTVDPQPDAKWKTVRAFSIIAPIIGGLATVGLWFSPFVPRYCNDSKWRSFAINFCVLITLFQGLTLLILRSNACHDNLVVKSLETALGRQGTLYPNECEWDDGSSANVASICLWFVTGIVMIVLGPPKATPRPPAETQEVTYEQTVDPETGARTVGEVNVVKGTAVPQPTTAKEEATATPPVAKE